MLSLLPSLVDEFQDFGFKTNVETGERERNLEHQLDKYHASSFLYQA